MLQTSIGANGTNLVSDPTAMRGHGGWTARVLEAGVLVVGDAVRVETTNLDQAARR